MTRVRILTNERRISAAMGYTYHTSDGAFEAGNYTRFSVFENALATRPFGLIQRDFNLKDYFNEHPNTGGKTNNGRVMDCLCRLDAVLLGKTNHEYPLLTPIIPVKQLYDIKIDDPMIFMARIERWAITHKRSLKIGKLKWNDSYNQKFEATQKAYECIDVLMNHAHMTAEELAEASRIILADDTSNVHVVEPLPLVRKTFDLRSGHNSDIEIIYDQTGEKAMVSIAKLASMFKAGRVTNVNMVIKNALVKIVSATV